MIAFAVIPFGGVYTFGDAHDLARRRRPRLGPALRLRDRLDRHLRHGDGGLGEQQQLVAARRPARLGADDLVRGHDGALASSASSWCFGTLKLPDMAVAQDTTFRAARLPRAPVRRAACRGWLDWIRLPAWGIFFQPLGFIMFLTCDHGREQAAALRPARGRVGADRRLLHRVLGHALRPVLHGRVHRGGR